MKKHRVLVFELSSSVSPQEKAKARGYYEAEGFEEDRFAFTRIIGFSPAELRQWSARPFVPVRDGENMVIPVLQPKSAKRLIQIGWSLLAVFQHILVGLMYGLLARIDYVFAPGIVLALPAVLLKPLYRFRIILRVQQGQVFDGSRLEKKLRLCLERFITRRCDVVIPISDFCARYARERGAAPARIVIRPPVVLGVRPPDPRLVEKLRDQLAIRGKRTAVVLARLTPVKGVDYAIRALSLALREVPNGHLLVLGDGPQRAELERLVQELGIQPAVTFLGRVPHVAIWEYIALSEVNILPTVGEEGLGRVLIETMLLGKPSIGTRTGGIVEMVVDGKTGYLVPPADAEAIADRLVLLWRDDRLRAALGRRAREMAQQWIAMSQRTISQILEEVGVTV